MKVPISSIKLDDRAQPRKFSEKLCAEYRRDMERGDMFPPVVVFQKRNDFWLADGFHRVLAARAIDPSCEIAADVRPGSLRDAILYSCGANAQHGYRRTNADKQRVVRRLLTDKEWSQRSDRWIAQQCNVHHDMVWRMRSKMSESDTSSTRQGKDGKSYPATKDYDWRTPRSEWGRVKTSLYGWGDPDPRFNLGSLDAVDVVSEIPDEERREALRRIDCALAWLSELRTGLAGK